MSPRPAPLDLMPCWREHKPEVRAERQFRRIPEERSHRAVVTKKYCAEESELWPGPTGGQTDARYWGLGEGREDNTEPVSLK